MDREQELKDLIKKQREIMNDPANKNPEGSFNIYNKATMKKLDKIGWDIFFIMEEKRVQKIEEK